jgi:predicted Zn finger-like uncharacterized protein
MSAFAPALSAPVRLAILRCPFCAAAEPVDEAALAGQAQMISCRRCGETWPARQGMACGDESLGRGEGRRTTGPGPRRPALEALRQPLVGYREANCDPWSARIVADQPSMPTVRRPWAAALSCVVAALFLTAFIAGRQAAVAAVPDLAGLYAAIGLPVHLTGLAIEDVEAERRIDGTGARIKVRGRLVNLGAEERPVPPLLVQFRDAGGAVLHGADAAAPVASLAAGDTARFVLELKGVPSQAGQVLVRLGEAR